MYIGLGSQICIISYSSWLGLFSDDIFSRIFLQTHAEVEILKYRLPDLFRLFQHWRLKQYPSGGVEITPQRFLVRVVTADIF